MPIVVARESNHKSNRSSFCIGEDIWFSHLGWSSTLVDEDDPSPTSQWLRVMIFIASIGDVSHWVDTASSHVIQGSNIAKGVSWILKASS